MGFTKEVNKYLKLADSLESVFQYIDGITYGIFLYSRKTESFILQKNDKTIYYKIEDEHFGRIRKLYEQKNKFIGNPLDKRDNSRLVLYSKISKCINILEDKYPFVKGAQKTACEIFEINPVTFSSWINKNKKNNNQYHSWRKDITTQEEAEIISLINKHLRIK